MKKILLVFGLLLSLVFINGCSKGEMSPQGNEYYDPSFESLDSPGEKNPSAINTSLEERKIKITINLSLSSNDKFETSQVKLEEVIKKYVNSNSCIVNQSSSSTDYCNFVLLVSKSEYENFIIDLEEEKAIEVSNKRIQKYDFTSSYVYTEERMKTLQSSKEAYVKLLETETEISNIIAIKSKLEEIDIELSSTAKIMSTYKSYDEYVTINISLYEDYQSDDSFFSEYLDYLGGFFVTLFKVIMYALPFLVIGGGITTLIIVFEKKRINKKKSNHNQ